MYSNFLRYAKSFAQPPTNEFLLSDIIPVAATAPLVAAQGFYRMSFLGTGLIGGDLTSLNRLTDTLMLATKGLLKVHQQEEAYGEVSRLRCSHLVSFMLTSTIDYRSDSPSPTSTNLNLNRLLSQSECHVLH